MNKLPNQKKTSFALNAILVIYFLMIMIKVFFCTTTRRWWKSTEEEVDEEEVKEGAAIKILTSNKLLNQTSNNISTNKSWK